MTATSTYAHGTLASIQYRVGDSNQGALLTTTAYWDGKGWSSIEEGVDWMLASDVVGEPVLLEAIPRRPRWRVGVGEHYDNHVYEGDRPVAMFWRPEDAKLAVDAVSILYGIEVTP